MDNKPIVAHVVSAKTGEITDDLHEGDRIIRKNSSKNYRKIKNVKENIDDESRYERWNLENFYKANISEIRLLLKDLSQSEKAFLFSIAPYVSFDDCHLQYGNGVDIGSEDLVKITQMSRGLTYDTIKSLIDKDILYKGKNSTNRQFFVNPWLFCKGNRINKVLRTMFKNYRIRVLGGKKWKDVKSSDI